MANNWLLNLLKRFEKRQEVKNTPNPTEKKWCGCGSK
jgi:hypothetical protein